ncbi:FRIGIDA-like protein 3 [Chenopodium quinoa]|uniref:FRIGIDA-like protein 3 n=1 Tax=Chenopodium quinoa TaxID=63459 RepID=UPI000B781650|nr:FRIGIDA-like protein 3 [Chenopodium quinoa]
MGDTEEMVEINMTSSIELSSSLLEQLGKALSELETHNETFSTQVPWNDVEAHFRNLESMTKKTFEELEAKEKDFTARESHYHMLFAEKEAAVVAKEQDLLDQVQELKDAAVAAITKARDNHKVSSFVDDENASIDTQERKPPHKMGGNVEGVAAEVNPCAELTQFCEQMDSLGLLNFVMENLENLSSLWKEQLSVALGSATEPARLVLDALAGFFPPKEMTQEVDIRDAALHGMRQSCLILMEALSAFLSKADCAMDVFLNPETQQQAKVIANEWKLKLAGESINAANENSLEAEGFLQLLATFRIASEFDEGQLCKYVLAVAHHRQATELCRYLDLTQKIPGLVDTLISNGRQIDAVHFIHAFKLSEAFPPVPLLRAYLKELRRNSQGNGSAALQNDYNSRELEALRAVIACVEQYKLEADYPLDPLHKRVAQLDKSVRGDTKRTAETGHHQHKKKPRFDRGFQGQRARGFGRGRHGPPPRAAYTGVTGRPERYNPAFPTPHSYTVTAQLPYAAQATDQRLYYPQDTRPRGPYSPAAPSYGSNLQPSHQPYA